MKKIALVVITLTLIPSFCFAANFAKTKKPETVKAVINTETVSVPEEKVPAAKAEAQPLLEEVKEAETETQILWDLKTPEVKVETKPAPETKAIQTKVEVKPVEKKAPQVKTPAFKDETKSKEKTPAKADIRSYTGKIDSVALGDVATGIQPIIVAVDDNGERIPFIVKAKTSITVSGKAIKLTEVKKGSKVVVEYTVKPVEGFTAQSIKLQ